jgi:hypothetical protein
MPRVCCLVVREPDDRWSANAIRSIGAHANAATLQR